ncbi:hypothetical protein BCR44DRAFT_358683 [Catenaria anguillulae PL171]|uniref:Uncharacterized protein n=1 Tax=Catenaria anguillulae PL171 TaxID=765915 RepID=A0A1Y2HLU8_9FUNG|nr:hypothetical protein BCR44DRAFT_358683 [Catenaria anguillulae PL171]
MAMPITQLTWSATLLLSRDHLVHLRLPQDALVTRRLQWPHALDDELERGSHARHDKHAPASGTLNACMKRSRAGIEPVGSGYRHGQAFSLHAHCTPCSQSSRCARRHTLLDVQRAGNIAQVIAHAHHPGQHTSSISVASHQTTR